MTDPIADMITRIKNAIMAGQAQLLVPHSKLKAELAKILQENGYIDSFEVVQKAPQSEIVVNPKYIGKVAAISDVKRISKPGRRVYVSVKEIPQSLDGYGITILSTSKGVMTGSAARKNNVGGEVLCKIW